MKRDATGKSVDTFNYAEDNIMKKKSVIYASLIILIAALFYQGFEIIKE
jgi:hypothetical protein